MPFNLNKYADGIYDQLGKDLLMMQNTGEKPWLYRFPM